MRQRAMSCLWIGSQQLSLHLLIFDKLASAASFMARGSILISDGSIFPYSMIAVTPRYQRGVTEVPGLYFVGLQWLHTMGSGLFSHVGRDAEYIVGQL